VPQEGDLELLQKHLDHRLAAFVVSGCADQGLEPSCVRYL
jgi:hypothetical protein